MFVIVVLHSNPQMKNFFCSLDFDLLRFFKFCFTIFSGYDAYVLYSLKGRLDHIVVVIITGFSVFGHAIFLMFCFSIPSHSMHKLSGIVPKWLSYQIGFGCEYGHYLLYFSVGVFVFYTARPYQIEHGMHCCVVIYNGMMLYSSCVYSLHTTGTYSMDFIDDQCNFRNTKLSWQVRQPSLSISSIKRFTRMSLRNTHATKCNAMHLRATWRNVEQIHSYYRWVFGRRNLFLSLREQPKTAISQTANNS